MKNCKFLTIAAAVLIVTGCMKGEKETQGGGGGNILTNGNVSAKTGIQYYSWLLDALRVSATADANPVDNTDNVSLLNKYFAVMDRLPGTSKTSSVTPGAQLAMYNLSVEFMNRFITDDLNRTEGQRLVLNGFATTGDANTRTFAAGAGIFTDALVTSMVTGMYQLLFAETPPAAVISAALAARSEMQQGIANPTAMQNRYVALSIFAALAAGPKGISK